jgi:hypothetical protein
MDPSTKHKLSYHGESRAKENEITALKPEGASQVVLSQERTIGQAIIGLLIEHGSASLEDIQGWLAPVDPGSITAIAEEFVRFRLLIPE